VLSANTAYSFDLHLHVPENGANRKLPEQIAGLALFDAKAHLVFLQHRTFLIKYKSWLHRTLERIVWVIPLVSGLVNEDQKLTVSLCTDWMNGASGASLARVDLDSRLQLYSARLSARATLSGLSYFWYHWRLTCAFLYVAAAWGLQVFWLLCWYVACLSKARCFREEPREEDVMVRQDSDEEDRENAIVRRGEERIVRDDDESVNASPVMVPAASNALSLAQTKVRKRRGK
jgi:hypothetical protein